MQLNQYIWNSEADFLGRGTFAEVFRAHTAKGNLIVALKIATEAVAENDEPAAGGSGSFRNKYRLEEEYAKGKDLSHTHIIRYWDLEYLVHTDHMNRSRKHAVLIMEYADKGSLEQRLPLGQRLAEEEAWRIACEILSGLTYLHDQLIIHRDLKPANILFKTGKLGKDVVKLTDFGISRDLMAQPAEDAASSTAGVGTSLYMAPEQFLKKTYGLNESISTRTDFWAWAVILYRMLTGYQPFGRVVMDYEALQHEIIHTEPDYDPVPKRFQAVLKACFKKQAAERPADQQEIIRLVGPGSNYYTKPLGEAPSSETAQSAKDMNQDATRVIQPPAQSKDAAEQPGVNHTEPSPWVAPAWVEQSFAEKQSAKNAPSDATRIVQPPIQKEKPKNDSQKKTNIKRPKNRTGIVIVSVVLVGLVVLLFRLFADNRSSSSLNRYYGDTSAIGTIDLSTLSLKPVNPTLKAAVEIENNPVNNKNSGTITIVNIRIDIIAIDHNGAWSLDKSIFQFILNDNKPDLKRDIKNIVDTLTGYGVAQNNIHFVVMDSLYTGENMHRFNTVLHEIGFDLTRINRYMEASDILEASLPNTYMAKGFVLDIEQDRTLLIYKSAADNRLISNTTYGFDYYTSGVADSSVNKSVKYMIFPLGRFAWGLAPFPNWKRQVCFVIGDGADNLSNKRDNDHERFTRMPAPETYEQSAGSKSDITAAQTIYNAVYQITGCRQFIHDWQGNAAIGFLLNSN